MLLAAVSALAATAAATAPLARVRRRVLQNLRGGSTRWVSRSEREERLGAQIEPRKRIGGRTEARRHLAERVVLVLERGHPLLELGIAELQVLGLGLQLRQVRLLPLPRLLRGHAVPKQAFQPVLLLVPRGAAALLPGR